MQEHGRRRRKDVFVGWNLTIVQFPSILCIFFPLAFHFLFFVVGKINKAWSQRKSCKTDGFVICLCLCAECAQLPFPVFLYKHCGIPPLPVLHHDQPLSILVAVPSLKEPFPQSSGRAVREIGKKTFGGFWRCIDSWLVRCKKVKQVLMLASAQLAYSGKHNKVGIRITNPVFCIYNITTI